MCDVKLQCTDCGGVNFDNIITGNSAINLIKEGYQVLRCSNGKCGASFRIKPAKLERILLDFYTTLTINQ